MEWPKQRPGAPQGRRRRSALLFVYGTLLRGEINHREIEGARFVREARTEPAFELVDLGEYPALVPGGSLAVPGELYAVSPAQLVALDAFEGHPELYLRSPIRLDDGEQAEAYLLAPERAAGLPRIAGGSWRARAPAGTPEGAMLSPATHGAVVWITGLPSSGKSTLAGRLHRRLSEAGLGCCTLDGDAVRGALVPAPGYTPEARDGFYATLARLAALLAEQGLVVVVPATAHRAVYRAEARRVAPRFVEVYVAVGADECRRRDAKGLYAATGAGLATGLPGADLAYEPPDAPDVVAAGGEDDEAVERILARLA